MYCGIEEGVRRNLRTTNLQRLPPLQETAPISKGRFVRLLLGMQTGWGDRPLSLSTSLSTSLPT